MSSATPRSFRHRRASSTPHDISAAAVAPSLLFLATELFTPGQEEPRRGRPTRRDTSAAELQYTFSFRRSEHLHPWQQPPSYETVTGAQQNRPSPSFSFSPHHSAEPSSLVTPLHNTEAWTPASNNSSRRRPRSSPVSPIISPLSSADAPVTYRPYRPGYASLMPENNDSPVLDLPSPFASPFFFWSGSSNQVLSPEERMHQAQLDDLELMSPFGSPAFYWSGGQAPQDQPEESMLDKAKKAWEKLGRHKPNNSRQAASSSSSRPHRPEWDDKKKAYVLVM